MKSYRPSSELQRLAEEAWRNERRRAAWRARHARWEESNRRGGSSAGHSPPPAAGKGGASTITAKEG